MSLIYRICELVFCLTLGCAVSASCQGPSYYSAPVLRFQGTEKGRRTPMITSLLPTTGSIGTVVVLRGKNFTRRDNVIQFKGETNFAADSPVESRNGTSLQFRVTSCPSRQPQCPGFYIPQGVYRVSVMNAGGQSNSVAFSIVGPR